MPVTVIPILPIPGQTPAVVYVAGTVLKASALTTFVVRGSDMAGIEFTITRVSGASTTHTWGDLGAGFGGVVHAGFTFRMIGDTYLADWIFTNLSSDPVVTIAINGVPGRITFDTALTPKAANSASGIPFSVENSPTFAELARYSHKVRIGGALNEDQYACLAIRFPTPLAQSGVLEFRADTDKLANGIDFELDAPPPAPAPPPSYPGTARPFISRDVKNAPGIQLQPLGRLVAPLTPPPRPPRRQR